MPPFSQPIAPPAPTPNRRGLLAVATTPGAGDRWLQGITFQAQACGAFPPLPIVPCDVEPIPNDDGTARPALASWVPILLRGFDRCSTLDGEDEAGRLERATLSLTTSASHQAEAEFSDGLASQLAGDENPRLTDPAGWVTTTTATSSPEAPAVGLAALEDALAECLHGQRGVLHVRPAVGALWDGAGLLHPEGGLLVTANDNLVVIGSGYSGASPTGTGPAAGSSWAYGTALVYQQQGETRPLGDTTADRLDRFTNTIDTWVTRMSLVWTSPCCKVAAEIDITTPSP